LVDGARGQTRRRTVEDREPEGLVDGLVEIDFLVCPTEEKERPVLHDRPAELRAVLGVKIGLPDRHILPVDLELVGDDHRQHRLDTLTHFGIDGHDRHRAIGRDADEHVRYEGRGRRTRLLTRLGHRLETRAK